MSGHHECSVTLVASRVVGKRRIAGTDWPIENVVTRHRMRGRSVWVVSIALCNGVPEWSDSYATRREAMAAAGISAEGATA